MLSDSSPSSSLWSWWACFRGCVRCVLSCNHLTWVAKHCSMCRMNLLRISAAASWDVYLLLFVRAKRCLIILCCSSPCVKNDNKDIHYTLEETSHHLSAYIVCTAKLGNLIGVIPQGMIFICRQVELFAFAFAGWSPSFFFMRQPCRVWFLGYCGCSSTTCGQFMWELGGIILQTDFINENVTSGQSRIVRCYSLRWAALRASVIESTLV